MGDTERTVDSTAIFKLSLRIMTVFTKVEPTTSANKERFRAAEHAFPSDVVSSMLLAILVSKTDNSEGFNLALFAQEVFFCLSLLKIHFFFTVYEPAEVGSHTFAALIERAPME